MTAAYNDTVCNDKSTFSDLFLAPNLVKNFITIARRAICCVYFGDFASPYPEAFATSVVKKVLAAVRTLVRFGISDRAAAVIVSAALQDVGIISKSNVLNVVDRNKILRGRTKARTTLLSRVINVYDHDQFGLYFDGRKDRTLSKEDNRRKVIIEEHISLVNEPGSEYIGHVSVNFGRAQIIGNNIYSFLSYVDIDVTKLVAAEHLPTQVSK
ncbi:hypothetical protein AVEN_46969-1 [Araneus ventricosus]|uniref:Uncharacterized protein n=1 Tax=Araneus ventricosus TaxID=182803 RepID=A0A4Y2I427_ARAVE|nr:hypothetical protein AVEN_46969-1 [Araneus ventricosus]